MLDAGRFDYVAVQQCVAAHADDQGLSRPENTRLRPAIPRLSGPFRSPRSQTARSERIAGHPRPVKNRRGAPSAAATLRVEGFASRSNASSLIHRGRRPSRWPLARVRAKPALTRLAIRARQTRRWPPGCAFAACRPASSRRCPRRSTPTRCQATGHPQEGSQDGGGFGRGGPVARPNPTAGPYPHRRTSHLRGFMACVDSAAVRLLRHTLAPRGYS